MGRTDWGQIVFDKQLAAAKSNHKKIFVSEKIPASELPEYIDAGWEKSKDYKSPKFVGVSKEKPIGEQFEDRVWLLFASMGFDGLNEENGIQISYDFNNDELKERIGVVAVDEETVLIVVCYASETMVERSFVTEINDFSDHIHVASQLALREYVGQHKLDEILENKEEMSEFVFSRLKSKESELFVEFVDAGIKDIILPGEVREIMNTVLVAEKRAQANVITRREEVASTRSLLNTAKLMDENQTLYKLKELEYVERICENVGNITLSGNGDILAQLTTLLTSKKA